MTALPGDDDLLKTIRSRHGHMVIFFQFSCANVFNISIGSLCFFCIHDMDIMVIEHFRLMSFYAVRIKHHDQICTFFCALIIAQNV